MKIMNCKKCHHRVEDLSGEFFCSLRGLKRFRRLDLFTCEGEGFTPEPLGSGTWREISEQEIEFHKRQATACRCTACYHSRWQGFGVVCSKSLSDAEGDCEEFWEPAAW